MVTLKLVGRVGGEDAMVGLKPADVTAALAAMVCRRRRREILHGAGGLCSRPKG